MESSIRVARNTDAASIAAIYAESVIDSFVSFELEPPGPDEMLRRMTAILVQWPWLVCERNGQVVGYAYASEHRSRPAYRWSVDVSVYVARSATGQGVGKALYQALLDLLRLQGFYNVYGGVALPNPASVGLHEAMGFKPLAVYRAVGYKLGAWRDVGWWHLALREPMDEPRPPRSFSTLREAPEAIAALTTAAKSLRP